MRMFVCFATLAVLSVTLVNTEIRAADDDSAAATKTRKLLKKKISVEFKELRLEDALNEIKDEVKGLKFLIDTKNGVSRNQKITYAGKDKTVEKILDEMLTKPDLGYIVISKKGNAYDGLLQIRKTNERGYPKK